MWNLFISVWLGAATVVVVALVVEDNINRFPKSIQAWWKRHICDTEENLWPNG